MEPISFVTVSGPYIGAYDCGTQHQNLVCIWVENDESFTVDESVCTTYEKINGAILTPNEARVIGKALIDFANFCDDTLT